MELKTDVLIARLDKLEVSWYLISLMKDLQREIINQVAGGKITPEEGAARLQSLEEAEPATPVGVAAGEGLNPSGGPETRRVKVVSQIGTAEIVGDPSVAYVVAEGPHRARQDGDTIVSDHAAFRRKRPLHFRS